MARITLFAGHYGSGKTNLAINYARRLRRAGVRVTIADLDIVNPYFRTKDSAAVLESEGIGLVVSSFANSNVDFPAMPKEIYALVAERDENIVMDIGGDDRGALALGRYADDIRAENDYEMLAVVNASRPLTRTASAAVGVLREIEAACGIAFTGVVNNTNLGPETTAECVRASQPYAEEIAHALGVAVHGTCCIPALVPELTDIPNLISLDLQHLYYALDSSAS